MPLFREPDSLFVEGAVASPDGRAVAMLAGPCTDGPTHVVVRDLVSGTVVSIGSRLPRCTGLGEPAWSASGRELVVAYGALRHPDRPNPADSCPVTRYAKLAIMSALRPSQSADWKLIAADPGCSFQAATFDRDGIAAVEGCREKSVSGSRVDPGLGQARLLQLNRHGKMLVRVDLQPGWEQGVVATERSGEVLITQDQPANQSYPERDWVWEFDGRHLRLIDRYRADDAAEILATPYWEGRPARQSEKARNAHATKREGRENVRFNPFSVWGSLGVSGDPVPTVAYFPDGTLRTMRWSRCPNRGTGACAPLVTRDGSAHPGPQPAGTVFRFTATYHRRTYTDTLTWHGPLRSLTPPALHGQPRIGRTVRVTKGAWRGGWGPENEQVGIEACRNRQGNRCVMLAGEQLSCSRAGVCGSNGGSPNQPSNHVRITAKYRGWYLFGLDAHVVLPISGLVGYNEAGIPPWTLSATVVRSRPNGPVTGTPASGATSARMQASSGSPNNVSALRPAPP